MKSIRIICIALSLALLMGMTAFAAVREPDVDPAYTHVSGIKADLSISGGTAKVTGKITPTGKQKTTLTTRLQQKVDGKWKTIATWTGSNASGPSVTSDSKRVEAGYSYRTYSTGKVYDSSGKVLETASKASPTKSY